MLRVIVDVVGVITVTTTHNRAAKDIVWMKTWREGIITWTWLGLRTTPLASGQVSFKSHLNQSLR